MKSTNDSITETQEWWKMFGMNVHPLTQLQLDDAHERRRSEEHVLDIWSTEHVPEDQDECYVAWIT
jgi:hypothetical protein